jgi:hypothetical protein
MEKACHRSIAVKRPQDVGTPTQIPEEPQLFDRIKYFRVIRKCLRALCPSSGSTLFPNFLDVMVYLTSSAAVVFWGGYLPYEAR